MLVLVCSRCLTDIMSSEYEFNVFDCSWECPQCKRLWLSSDSVIVKDNIWLFCRWEIDEEGEFVLI